MAPLKRKALPLVELLIPLALAVLLFVTKKQAISTAVYTALAVTGSFYFFPLRLFVGGFLKVPAFQRKVIRGFASLVLSQIAAFSVVLLYAESGHPLYPVTMASGVINVFLLIHFMLRNADPRLALSHFGFMLLLGVIVFV